MEGWKKKQQDVSGRQISWNFCNVIRESGCRKQPESRNLQRTTIVLGVDAKELYPEEEDGELIRDTGES